MGQPWREVRDGRPRGKLVLPQKRIVRVKTDCLNQGGEPVATGEAVVLLDPAPQ